jgi:hypothetical protein
MKKQKKKKLKTISIKAQEEFLLFRNDNWNDPYPSIHLKYKWVKSHPDCLNLKRLNYWFLSARKRILPLVNAKLQADPKLDLEDFKEEILKLKKKSRKVSSSSFSR